MGARGEQCRHRLTQCLLACLIKLVLKRAKHLTHAVEATSKGAGRLVTGTAVSRGLLGLGGSCGGLALDGVSRGSRRRGRALLGTGLQRGRGLGHADVSCLGCGKLVLLGSGTQLLGLLAGTLLLVLGAGVVYGALGLA